nr:hypothetical protein DM860_005930 [Ipomoea trifida]
MISKGHRGKPVAEPWVSQGVESNQKRDDLDVRDIQDNDSNQTEDHEQRCSSRAVISHPHNVRRAGGREGIELLVELVRVGVVSTRKPRVHVGRMPRLPSVVPHSNQEQSGNLITPSTRNYGVSCGGGIAAADSSVSFSWWPELQRQIRWSPCPADLRRGVGGVVGQSRRAIVAELQLWLSPPRPADPAD